MHVINNSLEFCKIELAHTFIHHKVTAHFHSYKKTIMAEWLSNLKVSTLEILQSAQTQNSRIRHEKYHTYGLPQTTGPKFSSVSLYY